MSDERAVQEVMARYVRAADRDDEHAMAALFMPDGCIEVFRDDGEGAVPIGKFEGRAAMESALVGRVADRSPRTWSHRITHDPIVSIHGVKATIDVRFLVFGKRGAAGSSPFESAETPSRVEAIDSGIYHANLKQHAGAWLISDLRITHDLS